jgi:regulatory protein SWI5
MKNKRAQTIFQEMRDHAGLSQPPSPPESAPLPSSARFDSARMPQSTGNFMNMSNLKMDFGNGSLDGNFAHGTAYESSNCSPTTSNLTPELSSRNSSPETSHASLFADSFNHRPALDPPNDLYYAAQHDAINLYQHSSSPQDSYHQRSESVESINIEETVTDTGITIDDIAEYISGPDPIDQKWLCLFPECKKKFGRKENIKSHVQTHLGDRQFQCPHCRKCFVRQHDLKRHAKIHSGVKPYPCLCGNSFARHDALTRHRQRGMCIGAFDGIVKKVVKRGRPRKARPDDEERLEKSSKTRSKNGHKAMSSASSISSYSESSSSQSPYADNDILDEEPFRDFISNYQPSAPMDTTNFRLPSAESPLPNDCVSPQAIQNAPSPSAMSSHSHHSYVSHSHSHHSNHISELQDFNANSPTAGASQYNSPPELCLSSPPNSQFYDEGDEHMDLSKLVDMQHVGMDLSVSDRDDDMFLEAFGSEANDEMLLMSGKFDDAFAAVRENEDVFGNGEDVFFGSP